MKGFYINACPPNIPQVFKESLSSKKLSDQCIAVYKQGFQLSANNLKIVGWFIYDGKLNNIESLSNDLDEDGFQALDNIEFGVYSGIFYTSGESYFFQDNLGLNFHYLHINENEIIIAPTIKAIEDSAQLKVSTLHESFLSKRGHLFGSCTKYQNVTCLPLGAIVALSNGKIVKQRKLSEIIKKTHRSLECIPSMIRALIENIPEEQRSLALSGGFDSRLIISQSKMKSGYCYGPEDSADRPIARQFKSDFDNFHEFEFDQNPATEIEAQIFYDLVESPQQYNDPQFINAYQTASKLTNESDFFFDGYLGDVFQRGTYLYFPGVLGELYRFFPSLYKISPFNAEQLLRRRYSNLNKEEFIALYESFCCETQNLNLPDYNKVILYEAFYARGRRFISRGALSINGCFKEVVPVFMLPALQSIFAAQNYHDAVSFKNIKKIWKEVDLNYKTKKFENGYSLETPSFMMPKLALLYRLLIHFVPGFQNYSTSNKK